MKHVKDWKAFRVGDQIYADLVQIEYRGKPEFYLEVSGLTKDIRERPGKIWSTVTISKPGLRNDEIIPGKFFRKYQRNEVVDEIIGFLSGHGMEPVRLLDGMPVYRLKEEFLRAHVETIAPVQHVIEFGGIKYAS